MTGDFRFRRSLEILLLTLAPHTVSANIKTRVRIPITRIPPFPTKMSLSYFERMIDLAERTFATRSDPDQISVTERDRAKLLAIHPSTMSESSTSEGPIAWMLVIPTTGELMDRFLAKNISEQELLDDTPLGSRYDAIYLCSAMVLDEFRGKGLAKEMLTKAVASIRTDHPIRALFYWAFTPEGESLAEAVARECGLPLLKRPD